MSAAPAAAAGGRARHLDVDGRAVAVEVPERTPLLEVLRDDLGMPGPRFGCGQGACGACTVLVDGVPTTSCDLAVGDVTGPVTTVAGLGGGGGLHAVQRACLDAQAFQCAWCSSGILVRAAAVLDGGGPPGGSWRRALAGHLCRCGAHPAILRALGALAPERRT